MGKSILILDDDVDFNSLLTDIFMQADYEVFSEQDPERALEIFREETFDLVVTDQKMPNLSGAEFMRKIKSIRGDVPVIMVSGYLDNETIRDLIKEGVGGVFLKPLNVFSLLKRTQELIEESDSEKAENAGEERRSTGGTQPDYVSSLPFRFRSYPCKSEVSATFAKKLYSLRNFKSNLLLVGESGTAFKSICEDLRAFAEDSREQFVYLTKDQVQGRRIIPMLRQAADQGVARVTLVLLQAQFMGSDQKSEVVQIARREGEYAGLEIPVRFVFCLHEDLDSLYEKGLIEESLYILMGTSEAHAPPLRECPDDIPILAQQYVVDAVGEKNLGAGPRIDKAGREWLKEQSWSENHAGLQDFITQVVGRTREDLLTVEHFRAAFLESERAGGDLNNEQFVEMLRRCRDDYARATLILCGGDRDMASDVLGVSRKLLDLIVAPVR